MGLFESRTLSTLIAPLVMPTTAVRLRRLPTRLVSSWTGLTHHPSSYHCCQARAEAVLAGRAISVPFPARHQRFATVNHRHSRSSDLRPPYYRYPAARMVRMGSAVRPLAATLKVAAPPHPARGWRGGPGSVVAAGEEELRARRRGVEVVGLMDLEARPVRAGAVHGEGEGAVHGLAVGVEAAPDGELAGIGR
jgi:hypothetical protein